MEVINLYEEFGYVNEVTTNIQLLQIPSNYFYSPWWVLGVLLFVLFVGGMIFGMGSVIGWKEFVQKIRILVFNFRTNLEQ